MHKTMLPYPLGVNRFLQVIFYSFISLLMMPAGGLHFSIVALDSYAAVDDILDHLMTLMIDLM